MQAEAQQYKDEGFTAFKMRFGYGPAHLQKGVAENLKSVEAIREVIDYDNDLMLECYMGWNLEYAKRMLPKLEKFEPRWLEEPVIADDIDGYAELNQLNQLNQHTSTPAHQHTSSPAQQHSDFGRRA